MQIEHFVPKHDILAAIGYWPGATSVILNLGTALSYAHRGKNGLPFRIPNQQNLIELLKETGPIASTSANLEGEPTVNNINEAMAIFRENVDFYVDNGDLSDHKPSRIIEILDGKINEIRGA